MVVKKRISFEDFEKNMKGLMGLYSKYENMKGFESALQSVKNLHDKILAYTVVPEGAVVDGKIVGNVTVVMDEDEFNQFKMSGKYSDCDMQNIDYLKCLLDT